MTYSSPLGACSIPKGHSFGPEHWGCASICLRAPTLPWQGSQKCESPKQKNLALEQQYLHL